MKKTLLAAGALAWLAAPAHTQSSSQSSQQYSFNVKGDALARYEWTRDLFDAGDTSRWRLQARPRVEIGLGSLLIAAGADALAVIDGVFGQRDIEAAARRYAKLF